MLTDNHNKTGFRILKGAFDRKELGMDTGIPFIKIADCVEVTIDVKAKRVSGSPLVRVAAISAGVLAMLPHNGAVVTLLAICGATQRGSYREIMMVGIAGQLIALAAVIALGKVFGAF